MGASEEVKNVVEEPLIHHPSSTPITQAQFLSWKQNKEADASAKRAEASRKRAEDLRAGIVQMNGRELFEHQPWVFDNDLY